MGFTDNQGVYHAEAWEKDQPTGTPGFQPAPGTPLPYKPWYNYQEGTPTVYNVSGTTNYMGAPGKAEEEEARYGGLAAAADARKAAQMNLGGYNADINREVANGQAQDYALSQYRGMIEGTADTAAQQQLRQGLGASLGYTASGVAGARGGGAGLAAAQAAGADAGARQTGMYQGALAQTKAREAMGAIAGYGQVATERRAQDLQRTGMTAENAYRQAQLEAQQRAINDAKNIEDERLRRDVFQDQLGGQQFGEEMQQRVTNDRQQARTDAEKRAAEERDKQIAAGTSAAGAYLGYAGSDVRLKKDIKPAGAQVDQALDHMGAYDYVYRDPAKYGQGRQVGPMANELAATPAGSKAVVKMPDGKLGIDAAQGTKLALAGNARLNQRVRELEALAGNEQAARWEREANSGPQVVPLAGQLPYREAPPVATVNVGGPRRLQPVQAHRVVGPTPEAADISAQYLGARQVPYYGPTPTGEEIAGGLLGATPAGSVPYGRR